MKVLVVGGGGREHALAWCLARSAGVSQVYVAPGNAGTAREPAMHNVDIGATDIPALVEFARTHDVTLTVVGPEGPLVAGIVDAFQEAKLPCFGPSREASQLEGSKQFTKDFLSRHNIPTAAYGSFTDPDQAEAFIHRHGAPIVIKADGLAAGKGVTVAHSRDEAITAARDILSGHAFGDENRRVVIEEFLEGEEASFIVMADGEHVVPMATSQDHKARDDGDRGPNTGGMGAYSPAPVIDAALHRRVMDEIITPTVRGMAAEGNPYTGFLYAGLMISPAGDPRVLEFNCRLGDPEAQVILLRLASDLATLVQAALDQRLDRVTVDWDPRTALGVVLAAGGYPGAYKKGDVIAGLPETHGADTKVFHAGTAVQDNAVVTAGGRVLCACALGDSVKAAQTLAYDTVRHIHWPGMFYRTDIGHHANARDAQAATSQQTGTK